MDKVYSDLRTELFSRLNLCANIHIKQLSVKDKLEIADIAVDAVAARDDESYSGSLSWRLVVTLLLLTIAGTSLITYFLLT